MELYSVLLSREQPVPVTEIAMPISEVLGRPPKEVTRRLKSSPWILLDGVPADALDPIFATLGAAKVRAKAVPEIHMAVLAPPLRVRVAEPVERGLFLQSAQQPAPAVLDWSRLRVASAGLVRKDDSEETLLLDLIAEDLRLRIDGSDFRHDYLGARMASSSRGNLKLFLGDVRERCPDARFPARTERLLAGESSSAFRFDSPGAFDVHGRWALQLVLEEALEEEEA